VKKLGNDVYLPEQGEVISFREAYGKEAGVGMSKWVTFGGPDGKLNPTVVCLDLGVFNHTEESILFTLGSGFAASLGGEKALILSTNANAQTGDPANIAEAEHGYRKMNAGLNMFVNDKDENPAGVRMENRRTYVNGRWVDASVPAKDQGIWVKPHLRTYLTIRRVGSSVAFGKNNNPISLYVSGGGSSMAEVKLDVTEVIGDLVGFSIDLGPLGSGFFVPDNRIK
jgi:hypothetical protein